MEKSVFSSSQQLTSFPASAAEESGWTAYFDDFSGDLNSSATSSLLSDAASHAACKFYATADLRPPPATDHLKVPRKLTLKPKTQSFVDIALEDTASSPDNSPKVADLEPLDGNNYRRKSFLGNGRTIKILDKGFEMKAGEYTELRKRGLCLVPTSMFANYMG